MCDETGHWRAEVAPSGRDRAGQERVHAARLRHVWPPLWAPLAGASSWRLC